MSSYSSFWKDLRQEYGLSQIELGRILGISAQFISNVERGHCRFSVSQVRRLMHHLDLNPNLIIALILADEERALTRALRKKSCGSDRSK